MTVFHNSIGGQTPTLHPLLPLTNFFLYDHQALGSKKSVALYFSASWCKPCREFTPKLVELYNKKKAEGEDFEVRPLFRSHGCWCVRWLSDSGEGQPFSQVHLQGVLGRLTNAIPQSLKIPLSHACVRPSHSHDAIFHVYVVYGAQVVFVSMDENEEKMKEYMQEMPWLAVPFADKTARTLLMSELGVQVRHPQWTNRY